MPVGKGKQVWPTVADLNTRVRRLVSSFLKHQRQQQLKVEKQRKQQARKEKEWEASRQRQLKKEEMAQKWEFFCTFTQHTHTHTCNEGDVG